MCLEEFGKTVTRTERRIRVQHIEYRSSDRKFFERELDGFLPDRIFDIHTHLWDEAYALNHHDADSSLRLPVDFEVLHAWSRNIYKDREMGYGLLPVPLVGCDYQGQNRWVGTQALHARGYGIPALGGMLVYPSMGSDEFEQQVQENQVKILKPYRVFAEDPAEARVTDYLPEPILSAADGKHLAVVLHLSKRRGPADEENLEDIKRIREQYPNVKIILAHCLRAFNPIHLEGVIREYAGIEGLWVDTSAVTDLYSQYLLLKYFDRKRILFGSDNIAAGSLRGLYAAFADGWAYYRPPEDLEHCDSRSTFIVYEQLRSQRRACEMLDCREEEIEDIFWNNAVELSKLLS